MIAKREARSFWPKRLLTPVAYKIDAQGVRMSSTQASGMPRPAYKQTSKKERMPQERTDELVLSVVWTAIYFPAASLVACLVIPSGKEQRWPRMSTCTFS